MSGTRLHQVLDSLAALTVTGVTHSYAINQIPERIDRAALPILVLLPILDGGGLRKRDEFEIETPTGAMGLASFYITHMLLYAPVGMYRNAASALPGLVDLMDNYTLAIRANSRLGGLLYTPIDFYTIPGAVTWAGVPYLGVHFVLRLVLEITT